MTDRVIILNGVSSSGKTTLARAIQEQAKFSILHVEMDKFISFIPNGDELKPDWFKVTKTGAGNDTLPHIADGPKGEKLLAAMRQFVVEAAQSGLDLVVDEVCHAAQIDQYRADLERCTICVVKVAASLEELAMRERARGDRLIGLAREQSGHLHVGINYDLEVRTDLDSISAIAEHILEHLQRCEPRPG
jgi:chloramphenicol 3-O phosphotransferase